MNFVLITLLVLMFAASCMSQYRNTYNDTYIPTVSCVCDSHRYVRCPPVRNCPTGIVRMCGCCPRCYRLLRVGEWCDRREVPVNEMCRSPMVCVSSVCEEARDPEPERVQVD